MMVFVLISVLTGFLYTRLPGSFLPEEDQGFALAIVQLPPGASLQRTNAAMADMRATLADNPAVDGIMQVAGFSFLGAGGSGVGPVGSPVRRGVRRAALCRASGIGTLDPGLCRRPVGGAA